MRLELTSAMQNNRIKKFGKIFVFALNKFLKLHTHGDKNLHTLLVKHFNDLLDGQKSQRSIDKVTYFYVGDLFCIHLGTKYANFQEKIFADISGRKLRTLYSSNVTTIQSLQLSPRNLREDFFLKIGILSPKVYSKNVPNIEA